MIKKIIILGAAESGIGAALLAKQQGYDVFVSDNNIIAPVFKNELQEHHIEFEEGIHTWEKIKEADEVIKSPGIPEKAAIIQQLRTAGKKIISEIEFAYRFVNNANIIAITGSNGKSTTTALTYHLLKDSGINAACVGNIGYSFARQVATTPVKNYVVEVSSFQLDDIDEFKPHIAILLNITPDHLDRYEHDMNKYAAAKFRIVRNQTANDYFIYCLDNPEIKSRLQSQPINSKHLPFTMINTIKQGAYVDNNQLHIQVNDGEFTMSVYDLALKGKHNLYNSMAAGIVGKTMDIKNEKIRDSLASFRGLEHRLEFVATIRGIDFINDSKATNINSVWFALESMEKPVILILGGIDKGNDYSLIRDLVKEKVKAIVCLGLDNRKIHEAFGKDVELIVNTTNAKDAVQAAYHFGNKGDVVLLSPACASFDLFKNYEDRGRQFKDAVRAL